jgi:hypothetical protein
VYGSKDETHNAAIALKQFLEGVFLPKTENDIKNREVIPCNGS